MTQTVTQQEIINVLYDELPLDERDKVQKMILLDTALQQEFFDLQLLQRKLDQICLDPSEGTFQKILEYSRSYGK